jgi:hypothetical protein
MDPQQAEQASQQLPDQVDDEAHSDLLQHFGIDPGQLAGGGSGQGLGEKNMGAENDPNFQ